MQPCCFFVTLCPDAFSKLFLIYVKPQQTIFNYVLMLFHSTVPWQRISGCCICCGLSAYTWYTWTCSHRTLIDEITRTHCAWPPSPQLAPSLSLALLRCVHLFFSRISISQFRLRSPPADLNWFNASFAANTKQGKARAEAAATAAAKTFSPSLFLIYLRKFRAILSRSAAATGIGGVCLIAIGYSARAQLDNFEQPSN